KSTQINAGFFGIVFACDDRYASASRTLSRTFRTWNQRDFHYGRDIIADHTGIFLERCRTRTRARSWRNARNSMDAVHQPLSPRVDRRISGPSTRRTCFGNCNPPLPDRYHPDAVLYEFAP